MTIRENETPQIKNSYPLRTNPVSEGSIQSEPSRGQRPASHLRQAPAHDRGLDGAAGLLVSPLTIDVDAHERQLVSAAVILAENLDRLAGRWCTVAIKLRQPFFACCHST